MTRANPAASELLAYYRSTRCSRQWRVFLVAFAAELFSNADQDSARGFMRQLGQRMASAMSLGQCESLRDVEHAMNQYWDDLDWGWCRLVDSERAIDIRHDAWPTPDDADRNWRASVVALLEGVYSAWLEAQGGDAQLVVRHVEGTVNVEGVLEFRYAR